MRQPRPPYPPRPPRHRLRRPAGVGLAAVLAATTLAVTPPSLASEEGGQDDQSDQGDTATFEAPFGDRIEPGTSIGAAAEVTTGTYTMNVPEAGAEHFFEVRRGDPEEVIWYGVTTQVDRGYDYAGLNLTGVADGDSTRECNAGVGSDLDSRSFLTQLASSNRSPDCRDAESIVISVANEEIADESLPSDAFYQLVIWREPAVEDTGALPAPNEDSPWVQMNPAEPQEVDGATSFTEAEPLADGTYRTTIRRGEPTIFAFPLTFGQHAQVEASIADGSTFNGFSDITPAWVSPLGGLLREVDPSGGPGPALPVNGEAPAGWSTPIVTYTNRLRTGGVGGLSGGGFGSTAAAPAAFAGTYFLALEIPGGEFDQDNYREETEIEMTVATITDYAASPPEYTTDAAPLSALDGSGYVATEEEEQAAREQSADEAPWLLVLGLFAGAALLAAVGGVAVGRVRRSRS